MKIVLKKICIKIVFVLLFILFLTNILESNKIFAYDFSTEISAGWTKKTYGNDLKNSTTNVVGTIVNVIRIVGTGIAIIMITYVAIKYMSAAPSEKADFKKSATAYIVGAVVLFASTNILAVIANFATENIK